MINVINNFTDNEKFNNILNNIKNNFPWYAEPNTNIFKHILIKTNHLNQKETSPFAKNLCDPLLEKLQDKNIKNLIINFAVPLKKVKNNAFKVVDPEDSSYIGILFLNSNDGFMQIYNQEKIKNEENRFVVFSKNTPYYQSIPTDLPNIFLEVEYEDN
tara:strand:+ start:3180 stop:3653 length:474 start_codon:yes stop_codon:yes gene_type:complete